MPAKRLAGVAVAIPLILACAACGTSWPTATPSATASAPAPGVGGWQALPGSPLAARYDAHAFRVGDEVLIIGGTDAPPCPPTADCELPAKPPFTDGATYDPATERWTLIAEAPVPIGHASGAVVGEMLYVWVPGIEPGAADEPTFLAYDHPNDRWTELPAPPVGAFDSIALRAAGNVVVAFHGTQEAGVAPDLGYDPSTATWSELPLDPLAPSFNRDMVWNGDELVLLGAEVLPNPGSKRPSLIRAAALDLDALAWRRLPDSEILAWGSPWFVIGQKVVNPSVGSADGGEMNNWGRSFPYGGILDLDSSAWSELPFPPEAQGGYPGLSVAGDEYVVSDAGWVLHVPSGTWGELRRPNGGADDAEAAVWAGDLLIVWGGVRWADGQSTILASGWTWSPT